MAVHIRQQRERALEGVVFQAMAIRSKSLNYNYLTISDSTASLLKVLMIGVFPLAYLGIGVAAALRRRSVPRRGLERSRWTAPG